jgi:hypothetical protein
VLVQRSQGSFVATNATQLTQLAGKTIKKAEIQEIRGADEEYDRDRLVIELEDGETWSASTTDGPQYASWLVIE